jgi:hypothetical protein
MGAGLRKRSEREEERGAKEKSPSQLIDAGIKELRRLAGARCFAGSVLKEADPEVVEQWKWRGVPVWSHDGLICLDETYKDRREDGLFNASLEGSTRRASDSARPTR